MKGKLPYWLTKQVDGRIKHRVPFPIVKLDEIRLREGKVCSIEINSSAGRIHIDPNLKIEVTNVWKKSGKVLFRGRVTSPQETNLVGHGHWDSRNKAGVWNM